MIANIFFLSLFFFLLSFTINLWHRIYVTADVTCAVLLVTRTCSSRIAPQLTALATLSSYCSRRCQSSLHPTCGRQTAQTWTRLTTVSGVSCRNEFTRLQCVTQATTHWDLVEHSADSHRRSHWRVGATTTSMRQSKGTSLWAIADAVTNRLFSKPPNATTQQPALDSATHILSKKIAMPPYA